MPISSIPFNDTSLAYGVSQDSVFGSVAKRPSGWMANWCRYSQRTYDKCVCGARELGHSWREWTYEILCELLD